MRCWPMAATAATCTDSAPPGLRPDARRDDQPTQRLINNARLARALLFPAIWPPLHRSLRGVIPPHR